MYSTHPLSVEFPLFRVFAVVVLAEIFPLTIQLLVLFCYVKTGLQVKDPAPILLFDLLFGMHGLLNSVLLKLQFMLAAGI